MTSKTKRCWGWAVCLTTVLGLCVVGCQPSGNQGTTRNVTTTAKQPDNKKSGEPKPDPG